MRHIIRDHSERKPAAYTAVQMLRDHGMRIKDATLNWFQTRTGMSEVNVDDDMILTSSIQLREMRRFEK